jgi:hypothetical protein
VGKKSPQYEAILDENVHLLGTEALDLQINLLS